MTQHQMRAGKLILAMMATSLLATGCSPSIKAEKKQPVKVVSLTTSEVEVEPIFGVRIDDGRIKHNKKFSSKDVLKLEVAMAGDVMIVASRSGVVQAFEKQQLIWATPIGEPIVSGVGFDAASQTAIVGTRTGKVVALDSESGKVRWVQDVGATVLAPAVIAGNRVLLSANNGVLHGLNLQSGASIWQFSTQKPSISVRGIAKPLRLDANTALFATADGRIYALNSDSGKLSWTRRVGVAVGGDVGRMRDVDGTPLMVGNLLYATSFSGHLVGFDMSTGRSMFTVRDFATTHPVVHLSGVLIGADKDGVISAFNMQTGERLWQNADLKYRRLSAPVVVGRYVAFGDYEGVVHIIDKNGRFIGQSKKGKSAIVSLKAEQNRLYAQTADDNAFVWQVQ